MHHLEPYRRPGNRRRDRATACAMSEIRTDANNDFGFDPRFDVRAKGHLVSVGDGLGVDR
jgi:hypothetical protein